MATVKNLGEHPELAANPEPPEPVEPVELLDPIEAKRRRLAVAIQAAEGLWKDRTDIPKDGVEYQRQLRGEWH